MRVQSLRYAFTIASLVATSAVEGASAQPTNDQAPARGEVAVKTSPALTAEQQLAEADTISRRATQLGTRLTRMLDEARREKDILRANCVNRKLTEVNANSRSADQRRAALKDAATAGDEGRRSHEYTVLTVLAQKLDQLNQEATQCLGQSVYEPGASQVITTVPNNVIVGVNPATVPTAPPPPPAVSVPPPVSGTE